MGFMLSVNDSINLGVDTIQSVTFSVDTPKDTDARTTDVSVTMTVKGKVLTLLDDGTEGTVDLATWSMVPAEAAASEIYRKVVVRTTAAGQVVREYTMEKAFVVDYKEQYGDTEGVGEFILVLRQKKDKIYDQTSVNGGYAS